MSGAPQVTITLKDVYDEVRSLHDTVTGMPDALKDHEKRLRALERWRYSLPALVGTAASVAYTLLTKK